MLRADWMYTPCSTPHGHVGARLGMQTSALLLGSPSYGANGFAHGLAPALSAHKRSTRYWFFCVCQPTSLFSSNAITPHKHCYSLKKISRDWTVSLNRASVSFKKKRRLCRSDETSKRAALPVPGINKVTLTATPLSPLHPLLGSAAKLTVE